MSKYIDESNYSPRAYLRNKREAKKIIKAKERIERINFIISTIFFIASSLGVIVFFTNEYSHGPLINFIGMPVTISLIGLTLMLLNTFTNSGLSLTRTGRHILSDYIELGGENFTGMGFQYALTNYAQKTLGVKSFIQVIPYGRFYKCTYSKNGMESVVILNFNYRTGVVTPATS